tara:strand:+ start:436 stop:2340 length:1905 start_codon:yes stop_codon:yes gene_type:complete
MAKITLDDITSSYASTSLFQANFTAIETEFNDKVLYRVNPVGEANQMMNDLDMNSNDIINVDSIDVQDITVAGLPIIATLQSYVDACIVQVALATDQVALAAAEVALAAAQVALATAQADAAAVSAAAALVSETNAATTLDTFQDIYWGVYASEPTLSPVGNPATEGDQYFNTTSNNMLVFNGTIWQVTSSAVTGVRNETTYTASAGVSTFAIIYNLGFVDVYVNGVKLIQGTDYTALTSTDITLTTPLALAADTLQAVAYSTVEFGDFGTAAFVNTGTAATEVPTNADVRNPRNRIVNPSMAISQENGDTGHNQSGSFSYLADQHYSFGSGGVTGNYDWDIHYDFAGSRSIRFTATSAISGLTGYNTIGPELIPIESNDVYDLNGKDVTLGLDIKTNWTGTVSIAFRTSTRSYVTEAAVTSGEQRIYVTVPFEIATIAVKNNEVGLFVYVGPIHEGDNVTSTLDTWQGSYVYASSTATKYWQTAGNYIQFTNVDLYAGNVAREFQPNIYAQDLSECQRYGFNPLYNMDPYTGGDPVFGFGSGSLAPNRVKMSVKMPFNFRTGPALILNNFTSGDLTVSDGSNAAIDVSAVTMSNVSSNMMAVLILTTTTDPSNYRPYWIHKAGNASTFFSARL